MTGGGGAHARALKVALVAGCLIAASSFGLRATYGLFTVPVSSGLGWTREVFAFTFAVQNLFWGIGQPLAGPLIDRFGPARVLAAGAVLFAAGMGLMPLSTTPLTLTATSGVMVGLGMGLSSNITVMAILGRAMPRDRRSWTLGVVTSAASLGQFALAPVGQALIDAFGWKAAVMMLASLMALAPLFAVAFARIAPDGPRGGAALPGGTPSPAQERALGETLQAAFGHPSYVLLVTGFFVCGFQLAFITVHLPAYLEDLGIGQVAGWTVAAVGLFNIVGSYGAGVLGSTRSNRLLLSGIYLARAVLIALFITLPPSPAAAIAFGTVAGLLWLSTVPLTSGLVATMFGARHLATLFGIVFFGHQLGSFTGAWLGGHLHATTGSYDLVWWITVALGVVAAAMHYVVAERPAPGYEGAA